MSEFLKNPKYGKLLFNYLKKFPRLSISAFVQPLTRKNVKIELEIKAHDKFTDWDRELNGRSEQFWLFVTDGDNENILHSELFVLTE